MRHWSLAVLTHHARNGNCLRAMFDHRANYETLVSEVFARAKRLLRRDATIYVRPNARKFTRETTLAVLRETFPTKDLVIRRRPVAGDTQTHLFGDFAKTAGEIDLILTS